jgi:hypothetical protein
MIGIIDESTPFDREGRVVYTTALVVIRLEEAAAITSAIRNSLARSRAFHWERDRGSDVRGTMLGLLTSLAMDVCVAACRCGQREQPFTRSLLLEQVLMPHALRLGVTSFVIERRSRSENEADGRLIRDWYRPTPRRIPAFRHVDKSEPLTWLADAAGGVWSDALLGRSAGNLERIVASGRLARAELIQP